jgi:NTE family protein
MKIGLALSGGGLRGIAHIGVIRAFEEAGVKADIISGTSAGSIIGALYAADFDSERMLDFVRKSNIYKSISFNWPMTGLASLNYLKKRISSVLPIDQFEDLDKPLYITMTNINEGKLEVMGEKGSLLDAIAASCAIPMIFEPVKLNGSLYLDGGVLKNLPASIIKDKCDFLIGVNLMPKIEVSEERLKSLFNIASRTFELSIWRNQQEDIPLCDLHLEIQGIQKYNILRGNKVDEIYNAGYQSAIQMMPELLDLIKGHSKSEAN